MMRPQAAAARSLLRSITWDGRFRFDPAWPRQQAAQYVRVSLGMKKGEILKLAGHWQRAREVYDACIAAAGSLGYPALLAENKRGLGFLLMNIGQYDEALRSLDEARELFAAAADQTGLTETIGNIGTVYLNTGDINKAEKYFRRQMELCGQLGDPGVRIPALNNLGVVYLYQGDYQRAIGIYRDLHQLSVQAGSLRGQSSALGNMALAMMKLNDHAGAMEQFQRDLAICRRMGDKGGLARVLANIGDVHLQRGERDQAAQYFGECLRLCRELGDKRGQSYALGMLAMVRGDHGDVDGALDYYDQAVALSREIRAGYFVGVFLNEKAGLLYEQGRYEEAAACNREALPVVEEMKIPDDIYACRLLAAKLAARNDPARALELLDLLLSEFDADTEKQADTLFARYAISRDPADRAEAMRQYEELFQQSGLKKYRQRIDELKQSDKTSEEGLA